MLEAVKSPILRLADAIGYPKQVASDADSTVFLVDGVSVEVQLLSRRVVLRCALACAEEHWVTFAQYVAGRFLREDAVLAWDKRGVFLWWAIRGDASPEEMRLEFERFVDACEWWLARVAELDVPAAVFPDVLIRP